MKKSKKMLNAISYYDLLSNSKKKNLIKRGKKMLNLYNSKSKLL